MIGILDYDAGNTSSVQKALNFLNCDSVISRDFSILDKVDKLILPGVGNFGKVIQRIRDLDMEKFIIEKIEDGINVLGICVGLQLLFTTSEESPETTGLSKVKGTVKRFDAPKVPQIGWNQVNPTSSNGILSKGYAYFVNSYYVVPEDESIVTAYTDYYRLFTSAIQKENITAFQFHPEKSGNYGLELLRRWYKC